MMNYSYLGKDELHYLTLRLLKAAKEGERQQRREQLQTQLQELRSKLGVLEKSHPVEAIAPLREKIIRLDEAIRRFD